MSYVFYILMFGREIFCNWVCGIIFLEVVDFLFYNVVHKLKDGKNNSLFFNFKEI